MMDRRCIKICASRKKLSSSLLRPANTIRNTVLIIHLATIIYSSGTNKGRKPKEKLLVPNYVTCKSRNFGPNAEIGLGLLE